MCDCRYCLEMDTLPRQEHSDLYTGREERSPFLTGIADLGGCGMRQSEVLLTSWREPACRFKLEWDRQSGMLMGPTELSP